MMTSREKIRKAINHEEPDRIPLDLGSTLVTGIQASIYAKLKKALGLKDQLVKVIDPFQILAYVEPEVIEKLGVDTVGLWFSTNIFGFKNENWKPWRLFDGTKVTVPKKFITTTDNEGNIYLYPQGDTSVSPSAKILSSPLLEVFGKEDLGILLWCRGQALNNQKESAIPRNGSWLICFILNILRESLISSVR